MEATNEGVSIQDRLANFLAAEEAPQEEIVPTEENEESLDALDTEEVDSEIEIQDEGVLEEGEPLDLSVIAQSIGLDVNQLDVSDDGLYVKTKIDGQEGKAKFTDLLKSYQLEGVLNKKDTALAEKIKEVERRQAEFDSQTQEKLTQLDDAIRIAHSQLISEFNNVNWQELERDEPDQYLLLKSKFNDRNAQLQQAFGYLQHERETAKQKEKERKQAMLQDNAQKLLDVIPEWKDGEKANKEYADVAQYALGNGYSNDELNDLSDYRTVAILRKAMLFDQLQKKTPEVKKKVTKAPKFVRPGEAPKKLSREEQSLKDARSKVKQTGGAKGTVRDYLLKKGIV